jgi:hypothetical protein
LLPLGVSDNSCSARFLSALAASLQAATYVQRVFRGQKACRTFRQPCRNHDKVSAATAIFRHGLPKTMSKKVRKCRTSSKKKLCPHGTHLTRNSLQGIVVMGATNRKDVLDVALTRPGRFDRRLECKWGGEEGTKKHCHFKSFAVNVQGMVATCSKPETQLLWPWSRGYGVNSLCTYDSVTLVMFASPICDFWVLHCAHKQTI